MATPTEKLIALLPDGAQVVVELDLVRLRKNTAVGPLVTRLLDGDEQKVIENVKGAELVVFGVYGLGTSSATTLMVVQSAAPVPNGTRVAEGIYALGQAEWVRQVEARGAIGVEKLAIPEEILKLRDHAMPEAAPGASVRVTARLPFDARVALARLTGLESAPAQVSVWADVVDDLAVIIDAEAHDPGEKSAKKSLARLESTMKGALAVLAEDPRIRTLGLSSSLTGAKLVTRGTWVRVIIAIGPRHLQRVVERALGLLKEAS